jgi:hypothetical protein
MNRIVRPDLVNYVCLLVIALLFVSGCASDIGNSPLVTKVETPTVPAKAIQPTPTIFPTDPASPRLSPSITLEPTFTLENTLEAIPMQEQTPNPLPQDLTLKTLIKQASEDLAGRLGVSIETIEFIRLESVMWSDGSLGCPKPGVFYIQVMVEGYRITLQQGSKYYYYHGAGGKPPFLCEKDSG